MSIPRPKLKNPPPSSKPLQKPKPKPKQTPQRRSEGVAVTLHPSREDYLTIRTAVEKGHPLNLRVDLIGTVSIIIE